MAETWLEAMIEEIYAKEADLNNLKRAANTFYRSKGEEPPFPDIDEPSTSARIKPDEYYGKAFATAARNFMLRRKSAVEADEVVRALEQGGFDFDGQGWKEADRLRIVSMSMAKNTAQFHRLPNGMFGLKEWYPAVIDKKKGKKAEADTAADTKEDAVNE